MGRILRAGVVFTVLWACASPAYAIDPILMFLFNAASQMISSAAERAAAQRLEVLRRPDAAAHDHE